MNYATSTSGDLSLNVGQASTTTTVTSSANPSVFGQPVSFTANVAAVAPGTGIPNGTVQFSVNGSPVGTPVAVDGAGNAVSNAVAVAFLGLYDVAATYSGDTDLAPSTGFFQELVNAGSTVTQVSSTPNPSLVGQSVTITATVAALSPAVGTPAGNVEFFDGATSLGTAALTSGQASIVTSTLAIGSHSLTAVYAGEFVFTGSTSGVANHAVSAGNSSTVLTSSPNPSTYSSPVTFTANVSAVAPAIGTPAGTVEFFDGATSLGSAAVDGAGQAVLAVSTLTGGDHSVTAVFTSADANVFGNSTSNAVTQTVDKAASTATLANPATSTYGEAVTLTATVSSSAAGTLTGSVEFIDGASSLGSAALVAGQASIITSTLATGSHSLTAVYSGDTNYLAATSDASGLAVAQSGTTTVVAPVSTSVFGQPVSFSAQVAAVAPGVGIPTGQVQFTVDGNPSGAPVAVNGSGVATSAALSTLSVGGHSVTASYLGDANFQGSAGNTVTANVAPAGTQTALASSVNPSVAGQSVTFTATVTVDAPGAGTPTGSVQFVDGVTPLGSGTLSGGVATFSTSALAGGSHSITAVYAGDGSFAGSTSAALTQVVGAAAQSITFGALGNKTFGDAPFGVSATASSGLPVSFSSQTPAVCTVAGSTVSLVSGGQCTVRASQAGDANWAAATPVDQSFTVAAAAQSITFGALGNKTYGDAPFGVSATATSALPVSFSSQTPAVCTVAGSTVSIVGAGQCTVRASQAGNANWAPATPVDQTFTVGTASLTATVQAASKAFGQPNPAFTLSFSGFVNGDTPASLTGSAVFTTPAETSSPVGTYPVAASGLTSPNYTISFVPGLLTVTQATVTVVPVAQAKVFGQADPAFTFGYTGFLNGDTPASIDTPPTCTVVGAHTAVASYPITCSGGVDNTYAFSYSTATLTVSKAATTTAIVSDTPDPSVAGQSYTVTWNVAVTAPGAGTPTGTVTVSDGTAQCSAAVGAGSCLLTSATTGAKTLTATYAGDVSFTGSVSTGAAHTVNPGAVPITFSSLSPNSRGRGAVSQTLVVAGGGFLSGATASFSGTGITMNSVTWNNSNQLTLVVSLATNATLGARNLTITNPGGASVTATGAFTVNAAPTSSGVFPDQISQGSTNFTTVVSGTNITPGATVLISGTGVTVNSATQTSATALSASLAAAANATLGWRDVTVVNADGGRGVCSQCIQVVAAAAPPTITAVNPNSRAQGQTNQAIVITGSNFATGFNNGGSVSFGAGITTNSVTRNSATQLTAQITVAANAALGLRDVTVTNPGGISATLPNGFSVTGAPVIAVTAVNPNSRMQGATNQAIVITGSNFATGFTANGGSVSFGAGITVISVTRNSATQLTARITVAANAAPGARNVTVTNPGGASATLVGGFSVTVAPTITSVSPASAPRGTANLQVFVNGTNFAAGATATISGGGLTISGVTRLSATQIRMTVTIAAGANPTARNVTVTNPDGGAVTRTGGFTIT